METNLEEVEVIPELKWVDTITHLLDNSIRIPILGYRIGLDPIIGLVPVAGEVASFSISGLMILSMARHGVSGKVILKMLWNIVLDALLGVIPFLGDIFDFTYKANTRNLNLLKEHQLEGLHEGSGIGIILFVLFVIFSVIGLLVYGLYATWSWLFEAIGF